MSAHGSGSDDSVGVVGTTFANQDRLLHRNLNWVALAAMTFSGMVGSGWLFASFYAAQGSGPLSLVAWTICAAAMFLVGVTFTELGVTRPVSGGSVRWPAMICGPFCGVMIGWVVFMQSAVGTPSEASGLLQYTSKWWPVLFSGRHLSILGLLLAVLVMAFFTLINWFGVLLMARINNAVTVFKVLVPLLTVVLLLATGFQPANYEAGGGFAPYGTGAMLTTIIGAGLVYSFGGINLPSGMAGEVKSPRHDLPLGLFVGMGAAFLLYLLLQTTFLGSVPTDVLAKAGWHGLNFDSPFADLAILLNMGWLSTLLIYDALISPAASSFVGIGYYGRTTYGLGLARVFPAWVTKVDVRSGIPRNALVLNFAVSVIFLLVFQSWQGLASTLGMLFIVNYAVIAVAAGANRHDGRLTVKPWWVATRYIAPVSFVVCGLIAYWASWSQVWITFLLFLVSILLFAYLASRDSKRVPPRSFITGAWLLAFMVMIAVISALGSFGGLNVIRNPWDSILVGVLSAAIYFWGNRASKRWLSSTRPTDTPEREDIGGVPIGRAR